MNISTFDMAGLSREIHKQDNRSTAHPLFAVESLQYVYGVEPDYEDGHVWVDDEGDHPSKTTARRLDAKWRNGDDVGIRWNRVGFVKRWEFVTACFSERDALAIAAEQKHNHKQLRVYAYSLHMNKGMRDLRTHIMGLVTP